MIQEQLAPNVFLQYNIPKATPPPMVLSIPTTTLDMEVLDGCYVVMKSPSCSDLTKAHE